MKRLLPLVCLCLFATAARADMLARIDVLVKGGAPTLALRMLEQNQPGPDQPAEWLRWEKLRLDIYAAQRNWRALAARAEHLPENTPRDFLEQVLVRAAETQLAAGDGAAARKYLRRLLSGHRGEIKASEPWRKLVIRSYLIENAVDDAKAALQRYRQDFRATDASWSYLHARVLLRAGDPKGAAKIVGERQTHEGRLLRLTARLRAGDTPPAAALTEARRLAQQTEKLPELNRQAWALLAEAAAKGGERVMRVEGLERALTGPAGTPVGDGVFDVNADQLWEAYQALGETTGNAARLLIGSDEAWLKKARDFERSAPQKSRAIHALLAQSAQAEDPGRAHRRLLEALYRAGLGETAVVLYTRSARYATQADIPAAARYFLAEQALKTYDAPLAAGLMDGLNEPPAGERKEFWLLKRARIAVYAGQTERALALMDELLDGRKEIDDALAERVVQVIFDLQTVGRHADAYRRAERVHDLAVSTRQKRETLYWMGDAAAADDNPRLAAELFLRSAFYKTPAAADEWGQAARYRAAGTLTKAGFAEDARSIYRELYQLTTDPKKRAVLDQHLQQLWVPATTTR